MQSPCSLRAKDLNRNPFAQLSESSVVSGFLPTARRLRPVHQLPRSPPYFIPNFFRFSNNVFRLIPNISADLPI